MDAPAQSTPATKKILPLILATAIFMQMLDSTILNTSLPSIARDLKESPLNMQNAIISYVLTLAVFMPVSGFLADKFGTRTIFVSALVLFTIGSVLCALSPSLSYLLIARVVQGLGGALMTPVGRLALIKTFDKNEVLRAMNFAIVPGLIGPVLGPLVGGYLVDYFSWHWIFLINIPIGIAGVLLGLRYMPNYTSPVIDFDLKGFLIFAAASLALCIALETLGHAANLTPVLLIFILGFLLLYFYYRHARIDNNPLFPLNLFQIRTFRVGILGNLATRLGISSVPLLVPLMIQLAFKQTAVTSGWIVAPMALTAMFGKSFVIRILNRLGYRRTLMANTMIIGVIIILLGVPTTQNSIYVFVPLLALLGFFNSIQFTAMNTISIADLRVSMTSSGNSLVSVNQQLAVGFGTAFGLLVLHLFEQDNGDLHPAFRHTFWVVGALTVVSGFVFRRLHIRDGENMHSETPPEAPETD
ncbi:MAG: MFS transporter [Sphingobacteriales bacterium]|nr:MAG: MFS transporter [Sphingobacteriales bacterium]